MNSLFNILAVIIAVPLAAVAAREVLRVPRRQWGLPLPPEVRGHAPLTPGQGLYWRLMGWVGMDTHLHRELIRMARLQPGERVMDTGSGTGELALLLKTVVGPLGSVAGIDINEHFLARSRQRAEDYGLPVEFKNGNAAAIPFAPDTFDAVTCSLMAHHLPTEVKAAMLGEILRVLKPGGRLVFFDIARPTRLDEWWRVLLLFSLDLLFEWHCGAANLRGQLPGMIRAAGFHIVADRWWQMRGVRTQFLIGQKAAG
ncbi:MAG: methyltransferase domain-containing protein [Chloroflexi bacterium]|nr:methyltransferase domain-containing protein [Chloroflexota bacterium]